MLRAAAWPRWSEGLPTIDVALLPDRIGPHAAARTAVVIDVLRATTMMAALLDVGAAGIRAVGSVGAARAVKAGEPGVVLAGERGGRPPEGFDMGNSPTGIDPGRVRGRTVVLTTTNGTRAVEMVDPSARCLMLALTNLDAVAECLRSEGRDVVVVCSGTDGGRSDEDELAAGLLVDRLRGWALTDAAQEAADRAAGSIGASGGIEPAVRRSPHARRLEGLGFGDDVIFCARVSVTRTIPTLDRRTGLIVPG
jgi:2-phosphosulfolactate phosphatase